MTAIAIDPHAASTVYIGAIGSGVWKTSDGGATWAPITDSLPTLDVAAIAVDPSSPSHIYVALAGSAGGVFQSPDGGISWLSFRPTLEWKFAGVFCGQSAESRTALSCDVGRNLCFQ